MKRREGWVEGGREVERGGGGGKETESERTGKGREGDKGKREG